MPAKNQEEFAQRNDTDFAYEVVGLAHASAVTFSWIEKEWERFFRHHSVRKILTAGAARPF